MILPPRGRSYGRMSRRSDCPARPSGGATRKCGGPLDTLSPFDLAFLDPPYRKDLLNPALVGLRDGGWLNAPALIVAERARR